MASAPRLHDAAADLRRHSSQPAQCGTHTQQRAPSTRAAALPLRRILAPAASVFLFLLLLLSSTSVHARLQSPPVGLRNLVELKLELLALTQIDGVSQTFNMDFFLLSVWTAPSPLNSTGTDGVPLFTCTPAYCDTITAAEMTDNFWIPRLQLINARDGVTAVRDEPYQLLPANPFSGAAPAPGWVWLEEDQRYQATFSTDLNMNAFPFDIQHLEMLIQTSWTSDHVRLVYAERNAISDITDSIAQTVGWDYIDSGLTEYNKTYAYNGATFSRIGFVSSWERQPQYYLTKIVTGTMMLVWMCIWNFSLQIDVSDRMMGTLQIFTGLISFLFVASGDTPKLPYQTRLDLFMMFSFCIVGFIMFIHGTLYYFREQGFEGDRALRLEEVESRKRREFMRSRGVGPAARKKASKDTVVPIKPSFAAAAAAVSAVSKSSSNTSNGSSENKYAVAVTPPPSSLELASPSIKKLSPKPSAQSDGPPGVPKAAFETAAPAIPSESKRDDVTSLTGGNAIPKPSPQEKAAQEKAARLQAELEEEYTDSDSDDEDDGGWEVRLNDWASWSFISWFAALACTRKWDVLIVPTLFLFYTIGCAAILGRAHSDGVNA